jgi:hypothetical protein
MAEIKFYADTFGITNLNGSGLGFYGSSFGASVNVGEYQTTTYITNGAGTSQGPQVNNNKYLNSMSGYLNSQTSGTLLTSWPNYLATLRINFTHSTAVQVQNAIFRIYDRSDINKAASGVTTKVAELIHPDIIQNNNGSGDTTWYTPWGSGITVPLANSPGYSGIYAGNGSNSTRPDTQHDHYVAISASPDSIGSKVMYAGYVSLEYL